jgi:hypothetical protein
MRWLGIALLVLAGCESTDYSHIKPPLREEYNLPPTDDARFSSPITYPKETLNVPPPRSGGGPATPKGPQRIGRSGGPGAGGY